MPAMPNEKMQQVLDEFIAFNAPPVPSLSAENARQLPTMADAAQAASSKHAVARAMKPMPMPIGKIEHKVVPGPAGDLLLRVYKPDVATTPLPVLVYFHGGGWVIATLDTYDSSCRALAKQAECIVVSVAYRQAPEHKFPAAADDAFAAYQWVVQNAGEIGGDPMRVAVGGESAGGNLAAVVSLMARDKGAKLPVHQLLVYPITNYAFDTESYVENADAKPLDKPLMQWFWKMYLENETDGQNPYASPLRAKDFGGLPPATVVVGEIDPLRSEGEAYASRLEAAGVPVTATCYSGVTHEFFGMADGIDEAKQAVEEAANGLRMAFKTDGQPSKMLV